MITTVLIDVDNTLLDFNACAKNAMRDGMEEIGITFKDEMFDTFRSINDKLWIKIEKGTITRKELHRDRFNLIFAELGIETDGEAFEQMFLRYIFDSHEQVEGASDIVKYLACKYDLYAASNGLHKQQINRLTKAGMIDCFKGIFVSETLGHQKPSVEFFAELFKNLPDVKKDEVIIIGDSLSADISGGICYGIKTLWYNHYGEQPSKTIVPDFTVDKLCEIKKIL